MPTVSWERWIRPLVVHSVTIAGTMMIHPIVTARPSCPASPQVHPARLAEVVHLPVDVVPPEEEVDAERDQREPDHPQGIADLRGRVCASYLNLFGHSPLVAVGKSGGAIVLRPRARPGPGPPARAPRRPGAPDRRARPPAGRPPARSPCRSSPASSSGRSGEPSAALTRASSAPPASSSTASDSSSPRSVRTSIAAARRDASGSTPSKLAIVGSPCTSVYAIR